MSLIISDDTRKLALDLRELLLGAVDLLERFLKMPRTSEMRKEYRVLKNSDIVSRLGSDVVTHKQLRNALDEH